MENAVVKLPLIATGLNAGSLDREKLATSLGWSIDEIYRAKDAWRRLYDRQPTSTLSFERYLEMMIEAALRPSMVGLRGGQWNLARYGDSGAYVEGNCRFIRREQNIAERREGYQREPAFREKMRAIALRRFARSATA